ncbi:MULTISPECIES: ABC transporter permease [unclassified Pseudonocardia]|uniref:ABC transporter permease n=1 Tax=unclassified Pseudonocardia TaxID=2619320 RepID=UPI001CF70E5B|nr:MULTISPECIES: ABC transporter permease [unclassified Pseudonocardia]
MTGSRDQTSTAVPPPTSGPAPTGVAGPVPSALSVLSALRVPFRGDPLGRLGLALLVLLLALGILHPLLPLGDPSASVGPRVAGPSASFLLGTDELGRSLLPRVASAIGVTIVLSTVAVLVATVIGVALGCLAAYSPRWVDQLVSRFSDVLYSFPTILIAVLISVVVGSGRTTAVVAIVVVTLPTIIRVARVEALRIVELDFVTSAEVAGARLGRVTVFHLLPNMREAVIVQATYSISLGMLVEGGISFLGLGVQQPDTSLGALLGAGRTYLTVTPSYVLIPGLVLGLAVLAFNLVGDSLRTERST